MKRKPNKKRQDKKRSNKKSVEYISDKILSQLKNHSKDSKILDIATGKGYLLKELQDAGFSKLHSADINPEQFKYDKQKYNFKTIDANKKLPYQNQEFDIVISSETIEHLKNPSNFISEVSRILKPKGTFILTTPNVETIFSRLYFLAKGKLAAHTKQDYKIAGHISVLPSWLIERFAKSSNLKLEKTTYNCSYIPLLKWKSPNLLLNKLFGWITIYVFKKHDKK